MVNYSCEICKKPSQQNCGQCGLVYYCSKEHQILDWKKSHKKNCLNFKIESNDRLGRFITATRSIHVGEAIVKKKPIVLAPKTISQILCLGCHKTLSNKIEFSCTKCSWPLCSSKCEESKHHQEECKIFSKQKYRPTLKDGEKQTCYAIIGPLRVLLLKTTDKYQHIISMQDHLEKQKNSQVYSILKQTLVPEIITKLKINTDENEILKICSIFDTNSFQVRDSKGLINIRGLYPTVSLISHDCKSNTRHVFIGEDLEICFSATFPIGKNELITTTYTQTLWGTLARREHLISSKNFECNCQRCSDPTEFGTYVGSIYCSMCRQHNKSNCCPKMISTDPLDASAPWECEQCSRSMNAKQYSYGNETLKNEILRLDKKNPKKFEEFLEKYKDILHPTNSHVLEVKYALSQMHGNMDGFLLTDLGDDLLIDLTEEQIQRKIDVCKELLEIADVLEPGFSRFRGSLLYDLHAAMVFKTKSDYTQGKITLETANEVMLEAVNILQESAKILIVEPDMSEILRNRLEHLSNFLSLD
nr:protein msta isoform X1 [Onthophagus taurus]